MRPYLKNSYSRKGWGLGVGDMAEVVESLPSKCKALSSNVSPREGKMKYPCMEQHG
jgi:hypothetical protein